MGIGIVQAQSWLTILLILLEVFEKIIKRMPQMDIHDHNGSQDFFSSISCC